MTVYEDPFGKVYEDPFDKEYVYYDTQKDNYYANHIKDNMQYKYKNDFEDDLYDVKHAAQDISRFVLNELKTQIIKERPVNDNDVDNTVVKSTSKLSVKPKTKKQKVNVQSQPKQPVKNHTIDEITAINNWIAKNPNLNNVIKN